MKEEDKYIEFKKKWIHELHEIVRREKVTYESVKDIVMELNQYANARKKALFKGILKSKI